MIRINALMYAQMILMLMDGPVSYEEMANSTGLNIATVRTYVIAMHKKKVIHISGWLLKGSRRVRVPLYTFGPGRDSKKPDCIPESIRQMNYRSRQKSKLLHSTMTAMVRTQEAA